MLADHRADECAQRKAQPRPVPLNFGPRFVPEDRNLRFALGLHPDGVHGFEGRFREVTPPERIVQTFEWDGMPAHVVLETVVFEDLGPMRAARRQPGGAGWGFG